MSNTVISSRTDRHASPQYIHWQLAFNGDGLGAALQVVERWRVCYNVRFRQVCAEEVAVAVARECERRAQAVLFVLLYGTCMCEYGCLDDRRRKVGRSFSSESPGREAVPADASKVGECYCKISLAIAPADIIPEAR